MRVSGAGGDGHTPGEGHGHHEWSPDDVCVKEMDKMPNAGGVYTPGYAFSETSLTERLTERGVTFSSVVQEIK